MNDRDDPPLPPVFHFQKLIAHPVTKPLLGHMPEDDRRKLIYNCLFGMHGGDLDPVRKKIKVRLAFAEGG